MATAASDLLASTVCVLRAKAPQVLALNHVMELLDALQDGSMLASLEKAAASGSMRWFDRVYQRMTTMEPPLNEWLFEHQLGQAMEAAVATGHMEIVQKIHALHPHRLPVRLLPAAAGNGDLFMLQWLMENRSDGLCRPGAGDENDDRMSQAMHAVFSSDGLMYESVHPPGSRANSHRKLLLCCLHDGYERALEKNQFQIVRWLLENGFDESRFDKKAGDTAASVGDLEMVQWLHTKNFSQTITTQAIDGAAQGGHLEAIQFLLANRSEGFTSAAVHHAIVGGYKEIEQWLLKNGVDGFRGGNNVGDAAAAAGDLTMVQWLHETQLPDSFTTKAIDGAAKGGHLAIVDFLLENRKEGFTSAAVHNVVVGGYKEIEQLLHANKSHLKEGDTFDNLGRFVREAAALGRLDLLQSDDRYAMDQKSECLAAMVSACTGGHLHVAQWLASKYTLNFGVCAVLGAAGNGHTHVLEWINDHYEGTDSTWFTVVTMDTAARQGQLETVQWLHTNRHDRSTNRTMDEAAKSGHLEVVQWLHENRTNAGCTKKAMNQAAANGDFEMVKWLHENRTEGCTTTAMDLAAAYDRLEMVIWLHENRSEGCTTRAMDCASSTVLKWLHFYRTEGCTTQAMDKAARRGDLATCEFLRTHRTEGCSVEAAEVPYHEICHEPVVKWLRKWYPHVFVERRSDDEGEEEEEDEEEP